MPDKNLSSALAALRPPAPTKPAAARALFRATIALGSADRGAAPAPEPFASSDAWSFRRLSLFPAFALPLFAVLLLLPLFRIAHPVRLAAAAPAAASLELLAQLEQLFPGQLDAVIDREGTLQLELSATPASSAPPADQALLLELTRGTRRLRILAYSGRSIRLRLDHGEIHFSPLLTGSGEILLSGDDFAWTPATVAAPRALAGWQVTARPLAAVL